MQLESRIEELIISLFIGILESEQKGPNSGPGF